MRHRGVALAALLTCAAGEPAGQQNPCVGVDDEASCARIRDAPLPPPPEDAAAHVVWELMRGMQGGQVEASLQRWTDLDAVRILLESPEAERRKRIDAFRRGIVGGSGSFEGFEMGSTHPRQAGVVEVPVNLLIRQAYTEAEIAVARKASVELAPAGEVHWGILRWRFEVRPAARGRFVIADLLIGGTGAERSLASELGRSFHDAPTGPESTGLPSAGNLFLWGAIVGGVVALLTKTLRRKTG